MESKGTIFKILPATSGTSQRTGNPWVAQQFVLEIRTGDHGQYKRNQVFEVFGEDRIKQFQLAEGASVIVYFDLEAREHEGKWFNTAKVYNLVHTAPQEQQMQQQMPQQQYQQRAPQQQQYQQRPQNGFYQPVQQGYPQPTPYYQPQPQYPPQQGGYPPQDGYSQQGGQGDLPF